MRNGGDTLGRSHANSKGRRPILGWGLVAALGLLTAPVAAQLPGGVQVPGGLPTAGLSKDSLLQQAKSLLGDLTSMKSSGKLAPPQAKQVDELLPKAQSLNDELAKPKVDTARLPQLASNLNDLQKQVSVLKGFMK
jgi:hypothetical protein